MYGSNQHKRDGIRQQPFIAHKVRRLFQSQGYEVEVMPASRYQDMKEKFDYIITFKEGSKPFRNSEGRIIESIAIDVKWAKSFTLYDNNLKNTLDDSKSMFIIFNIPDNPSELIFINTDRFRECLNVNKPILRVSEEEGNSSRYFFIEQYLRENQSYLGNFVKRYTV
jgi:hypothetical protein